MVVCVPLTPKELISNIMQHSIAQFATSQRLHLDLDSLPGKHLAFRDTIWKGFSWSVYFYLCISGLILSLDLSLP